MAVAVRFKVIGCIIFIGPKPSGLYRVEPSMVIRLFAFNKLKLQKYFSVCLKGALM